jgi:glycosyltransferase involved in cell wall biosynthesis
VRVTHVITRLIVGGAQENTIATVLGLQSKPNVRIDLISGPTSGPEGSLENCLTPQPNLLRIVPPLVRPVHPLLDLKSFFALTKIFKADSPDVVHTHSGKAGILGRLAAARAKIPIIIHTIHGPSFGPWQGTGANFFFREAEKLAGKVTTHFVAVAKALTDQYLQAGIGSPDQCTRIFSGFPLEPFLKACNDLNVRAKYGIAPDDIVIGKIARLVQLKGHDELFRSAPEIVRAFPQTKFLLIGGGPLEEQFRDLANEMSLGKHFVFTGLIPPDQIPGMIGIMDLLVHLSLREGLARALPQALAAGKPIVAYNCDGAGEVCLNGQTGFLIEPHDVPAFVNTVKKLAGDPALRKQLGENGRQLVKENFPVEKMVSEIYELYLQLLRQRDSRRKLK